MVPIFVLWYFLFKVCNTDWVMHSFCVYVCVGGGSLLSIGGFKMKDSINLEDDFIHFSDYLCVP